RQHGGGPRPRPGGRARAPARGPRLGRGRTRRRRPVRRRAAPHRDRPRRRERPGMTHPTRLLLLVVAAVLLAGACTVPTNDEPVELSGSIVPDTTTSTSTTSPETATRQAFAYFLETSDTGTVLRR